MKLNLFATTTAVAIALVALSAHAHAITSEFKDVRAGGAGGYEYEYSPVGSVAQSGEIKDSTADVSEEFVLDESETVALDAANGSSAIPLDSIESPVDSIAPTDSTSNSPDKASTGSTSTSTGTSAAGTCAPGKVSHTMATAEGQCCDNFQAIKARLACPPGEKVLLSSLKSVAETKKCPEFKCYPESCQPASQLPGCQPGFQFKVSNDANRCAVYSCFQ